MRSWNGFSYFSSVSALYRSRSRSTVSSARFFAPRGGRGVIHEGLRLGVGFGLGAKQPARYRRDLIPVRATSKAGGRRLHHETKSLRTIGLDLGNHRTHLGLDFLLAQRRWQEASKQAQLGLLTPGRVFAARLAVDADRLLTSLDFLASDAQNELVVDLAGAKAILTRPNQFAFEQGKRAQGNIVASLAGVDHFRLNAVIKRHSRDCKRGPIPDNRRLWPTSWPARWWQSSASWRSFLYCAASPWTSGRCTRPGARRSSTRSERRGSGQWPRTAAPRSQLHRFQRP